MKDSTNFIKKSTKKIRRPTLIVLSVLLMIFLLLSSCSKTLSVYGYTLGWNSNHTYVLKVKGTWDRTSFYIDGQREEIADLGKIPVPVYELRKQAELFARTRAIYVFQETMEQYFNNLDQYQDEKLTEEIPFEETEALVEQLADEQITETTPAIPEENNSQINDRQIIASNSKVVVFSAEQSPIPSQESNLDEQLTTQAEESTFSDLVAQGPNNDVRKTIDFRSVYEKVNMKITLLEKIYDEENDVEIIYLFSGRNLKDELARAFIIPQGEIEQRR